MIKVDLRTEIFIKNIRYGNYSATKWSKVTIGMKQWSNEVKVWSKCSKEWSKVFIASRKYKGG